MLNVNNLNVTINNKKYIENLSFSIDDGDKLAIIGEEGNGKSTLAKLLAKDPQVFSYAKVTGTINTNGATVGFLKQFLDDDWNNQEILQYFLKQNPTDEEDYSVFNNYSELTKLFASLGLDKALLESEQKIGDLSGGEKVKLQLIKLMLNSPDILILDEPTNDLDISTLEWLENFIVNFEKPIIFISHDEQLLERTANCILHVEQLRKKTLCKVTFASMSYKDYINKRSNDLNKQAQIASFERAQDKIQMSRWQKIYNKVEHMQSTISRGDPHGGRLLKKKMKSVKAQERRFERNREEQTEFPDTEESIYLDFGTSAVHNTKLVCDIFYPELQVGDKVLANNISLKVVGPEKVVIVGNNGTGKTTFLKKLANEMTLSSDLRIGYMPQNYQDVLSKYKSVEDFVNENIYDKLTLTLIRTFLACLKFTPEEVAGDISDLSGGQKAKLFLAKLMLEQNNVLILDEPTRNLSPLSNPVIREALSQFNGTIIAISHDRKFISQIATRVLEFTKEGLIPITSVRYS